MSYKTVNLKDIYIHDAFIQYFDFKDNTIIFGVDRICVHKECESNPHDYDTYVEQAIISIKNPNFKEMKYYGYKKYNDKNEIIDIIVDRYIDTDNVIDEISNMIDLNPQFFGCTQLDNGDYAFTILYDNEVIDLILSFESCLIQWNEFSGKAWYIKD